MKAEIITIGDEILLGQIVDTNSAWISAQLSNLNITVQNMTSISDKREAIFEALNAAKKRVQLVIVTGGLGPTKDDITKETIASFFQTTLVRNEEVLQHVQDMFARFAPGIEMPSSNFSQADVLATSEVLFNDVGTAPGMWVEHEGVYFVFLPGVPFEMKFLIEDRVIPRLLSLNQSQHIYHAHIITVGLGESFLAQQIEDIENQFPSYIKLAYLPKLGLVRLRLTAIGDDAQKIIEETNVLADLINDRLKNHVIAREDISLEEAIIKNFAEQGLKVSFAESCTGGSLAGAITSYAGASDIFDCGIVAYHNRIKEEVLKVSSQTLKDYGAVSEQTVLEMVKGVKAISNSDYAIATSGVAGPGGGTPDKPVGTVWVAVAGRNEVVTKMFQFNNNRQINIERTIMQSLILLWNLFKKETV